MAIEYTWRFNSIKVKPSYKNLVDVVSTYEWRRIAKDGEFVVDVYGLITLGEPTLTNFTEYQQLTEQDLIDWTVLTLSQDTVDKYDAFLADQIVKMKNPQLIVKPAPWQVPEGTL